MNRTSITVLAIVLALVSHATVAAAEAAPDRYRSPAYYAIHGGVTASLFAAGVLSRYARSLEPGPDSYFFPGDLSVRENYSHEAASASNVTLPLVVTVPVAAQLGLGVGKHSLNAALVYSETLAANLALNSLSKVLFSRPRPSTYRLREAGAAPDDDWFVSFYSGHSSTAFAAAVSGAYLFAEGTRDPEARYLLWASEIGLAAASAMLRVRAGKHYYSDVVVGALVGAGIGIGVPLIHGARYEPEAGEYVAGGAGLVLGTAASVLIPLASDPVTPASTAVDWSIQPSASGLGLGVSGSF
jgi:hypothetical protein